MMRGAFGVLTFALSATVGQADITVPSGQPVSLQEILWQEGDGLTTLRLRYVAPGIGNGAVDFATTSADMQALCQTGALAVLNTEARKTDLIVISLAEKPTEFGVADPGITQFFEAFSLVDDTCVLEPF